MMNMRYRLLYTHVAIDRKSCGRNESFGINLAVMMEWVAVINLLR